MKETLEKEKSEIKEEKVVEIKKEEEKKQIDPGKNKK